jgi:hypothetical protein
MTKSEKPIETKKSMLPILVGAIAAPLIINLIFLFVGAGPSRIEDVAFFIVGTAIFGAIIGVVSRLIAKTKWGAIGLTLAVIAPCNLCLVFLAGA